MTGENVFTITMAMIDEMLANGSLDAETTQEYRAKAPSILTMLQNELIGIDNRYRKKEDYVYPVAIESLNQTFQIDDIKASTLLTNGLAAHLMLHEDKTLANYFEQRYEEMKGMFLKPTPREPEKRVDVYDASLNY
jgi:hypothetical protein